MKRYVVLLVLIMVLAVTSQIYAETRIRCASTTSTQNSGLFDHILPLFEEKTGIRVDVVAVGTGAAIEIGKRGDADVVFVHAKELELKAVQQGHFVDRNDVMYNDFILIGPPDDPAGIREIPSASDALRKIADRGSLFVSRGDASGTHMKELSVWKKAGLIPAGNKWYLEVGQGMAKTQRIANEKRAYTLTDRGTWLSLKDRDNLEMSVLLEGDPALFNQYGVMAVNPAQHAHVMYKEAKKFIHWLVSEEGQKKISNFKDKQGNRLFTPNAKMER
ncbi:MAG: extracellular solute-binding protein [Nitrospiraceae bacterium]|nr:MAG: extracellular solute-binding protein [Nitrospiraceae bacterium]